MGFEPEHRSDPLLDRAMVLLDHVFRVLDPDHLDRELATEAPQHSVVRIDPGGIGCDAVNHDPPRQPVYPQRASETLGRSCLVTVPRKYEIKRFSVLVDRPMDVGPLALHPYTDFARPPGSVGWRLFGSAPSLRSKVNTSRPSS